jgi:fatty-acyl-CoA synthase
LTAVPATIGDLVDDVASRSDGLAVAFPDSRHTYPELAALTDRFARSLRGLGIGPDDKVGVLMPNCIEYVAAIVGTAKLGAVCVPVNGRFKETELGHVLSHADLRVLLVMGSEGTDYPQLIAEALPRLADQDPEALALDDLPLLRRVVVFDREQAGCLDRGAFEAAGEPVDLEEVKALQRKVQPEDVAILMYTSGTTALPKGCLLTHGALVRHAANVARSRFELTAEDRFWDPLPMFHCGGIVPMLGCFSVGAQFHHAGHFDPDQSLRTLEEERITVAYPAFEAIWLGILNHPRRKEADLSSLRIIQNITTPDRLAEFEREMPWAVQVTSFGSTECASNLTLPLPSDPPEVRLRTTGRVIEPMEIKIVDPETGEEKPRGEVGELCFRGYARFKGYYKDPETTAKVIDEDGWFHTGDLGVLDEQGLLSYRGRLKDMLKVGGENVAAIEIEGYLVTHPAVAIAQVVAAPDARYDEVPAAFIELQPGATATEEELIDYCVGKIATFKVPRYVRFVKEWPMSGTKVKKYELKERIARELAEAGITEAPRIDSRRGRAAAAGASA